MSAIGKCPWCGGEPEVDETPEWFVGCLNERCMASGPFSETRDLAITAWNRLATPDPAEVRGRIRWEGRRAYLGTKAMGHISQSFMGTWNVSLSPKKSIVGFDTPEAARAALDAAVREAIETTQPTAGILPEETNDERKNTDHG